MQNYFSFINQFCLKKITAKEYLSGYFSAEEMDFARFNHNKIRQSGTILQSYLKLRLISDERQAYLTLGLSGSPKEDEKNITHAFQKLREIIKKSNKDSFLFFNTQNENSKNEDDKASLDKNVVIDNLLKEATGLDLVGCYIGGPIYKGFFNSLGQINWFSKKSFNIDASIYYKEDQAVKIGYSDIVFRNDVLKSHLAEAHLGLELFKQGKQNIEPGLYQVYFSPHAVFEILSFLNFGGFSKKSLLTKSSPLLAFINNKKSFNKKFSLNENTEIALGPNFQSEGFLKPKKVKIIENGELKDTLTSPKTAMEYNLTHNGADNNESMCNMDVREGKLLNKDILSYLDEGLYINNLWYLNYSDKLNGRITGMTRFLCYTVKNGEPKKAFGVMRLDESIYNIFGDNLKEITKDREFISDSGTYNERATSCALLPGIIVKDVRFTL